MKLKPRSQQHIYKGLMVGYSRAQQFHVGIRASICVFILPMHICISLYIGRFCGQHGCKLVTAESIISATSDGGYCRSVHVCVLLKHDEHDIIGNQREWTFSVQESTVVQNVQVTCIMSKAATHDDMSSEGIAVSIFSESFD